MWENMEDITRKVKAKERKVAMIAEGTANMKVCVEACIKRDKTKSGEYKLFLRSYVQGREDLIKAIEELNALYKIYSHKIYGYKRVYVSNC